MKPRLELLLLAAFVVGAFTALIIELKAPLFSPRTIVENPQTGTAVVLKR